MTESEVRRRVDDLLDKINREGMTSPTDSEGEFLRDASEYFK